MNPLNIFYFIVISAFLISIIIIRENRDPAKTISWMLVLILLPGIGFFLYLMFGENLRKKKLKKTQKFFDEIMNSKNMNAVMAFEELLKVQREAIKDGLLFQEIEDISKKRVMSLMLNTGRSPVTFNNSTKIYIEGKEKFKDLLNDIENAKEYIHMEYFIVKNSTIGMMIRDALIKKAKEGVKVRFIYDDVGSWRLFFDRKYISGLKEAGVEIHPFLPVRVPFFHRRLNYRNHRKIAVIDGKYGYIGGLNIGDEYIHKNPKFGFWRDTHLRIHGEAVYLLHITFFIDWYIASGENLISKSYFPPIPNEGNNLIQIVSSGPDSEWESIQQAYFASMAQAKKRIYLQTPYFIPNQGILDALKTAALSGVDVKIMFPGIPDHKIVYAASYSYFEEILEAGGRIFLYDKGFLHAKTLVVDDQIASVGSANMDIRSFLINFEINSFFYDEAIISEMVEIFYEDMEYCKELTLEEYQNRPWTTKFKESTARLFSPIL